MNKQNMYTYFLFFIIPILCLSSLMSCGRPLLTQDEYEQTKGVYKSESYAYIDKQPFFDKELNTIECEYRIHTTYIESPPDWVNRYIQYGNVIDSYWVCKSLFDIKKTLAKTTIIKSTFMHPDLWIAETVKIKPQPNCQYWLEIYERSPWKNKESLLLQSKTFDCR